jgi:hypothetical protein
MLGQRRKEEASRKAAKNEEREATPDLLLKHPDATIVTYV